MLFDILSASKLKRKYFKVQIFEDVTGCRRHKDRRGWRSRRTRGAGEKSRCVMSNTRYPSFEVFLREQCAAVIAMSHRVSAINHLTLIGPGTDVQNRTRVYLADRHVHYIGIYSVNLLRGPLFTGLFLSEESSYTEFYVFLWESVCSLNKIGRDFNRAFGLCLDLNPWYRIMIHWRSFSEKYGFEIIYFGLIKNVGINWEKLNFLSLNDPWNVVYLARDL